VPREIAATPSEGFRHRCGVLVLLLLWAATWALAHGYNGIEHDGRLYTLQALSHLRPQSLSQDVFLHFGSQDRYTLFSPLYAAVISALGADWAAAGLTFTFQLAVLAGALLLARKTVSPLQALLGVSILLAIPGTYGGYRVFSCLEAFVTPRMGAEALVLCGLALALTARVAWAVVLLALATLLHPVMAAAGWAALFALQLAIPHPRTAAIAVVAAVVTLVVFALVLPIGPFSRFDPQWLELVRGRSPYLFATNWQTVDWEGTLVVLTSLVVGMRTLPAGRARLVCQMGLLTGLSGLTLTLLACDTLQLVHFTQLQPWRWMWLATVVAVVMLPAMTWTGWQAGAPGKATAVLLAAAWILGNDPLATYVAVGAVACLFVIPRLDARAARLVFYGAGGLLGIAIAARIGWNSLFLNSFYYDPALPEWLRKVASFTQDGTIPVALALLTLWLASRPRGLPGIVALAILTTGACISLVPATWTRWTHQQFPASLVARFAPWRALIPPGNQVLWPEAPLEAALLLDRPNYLSTLQTTGVVFSREAAIELRRRADALSASVAPSSFLQFSGVGLSLGPTVAQLERACETGEFAFLVTGARLGWPPLAQLPADVWHNSRGLRLYRCADRGHG